MASEYEIAALRAELAETQRSMANLQGAVEQLTYHLQNVLPQDIADAIKTALKESKDGQGQEAG